MATLSDLANAIRSVFGVTGGLTVPEMTSTISSGTIESSSEAAYIDRSITSAIIPSSVRRIGDYAFLGCTNLTTVVMPSSVSDIEYYAFKGCSLLTSITMPSIVSIDKFAFSDCSSLTAITLPSSVRSIGAYAFEHCTSLTDIYCGFAEGAVSGAPWGAPSTTTIHYNSTGPTA